MKIASVAEVKAKFSAYLNATEGGPVIVTRNGKPVAVLLPVADEDELEGLVLAYSPKFRAILNAAHQRIREAGGIPHEQFWEEVERERQVQPKKPKRKGPGRATKAK
jgi:prevent-host-death family protein